jgi:hypothetical protein
MEFCATCRKPLGAEEREIYRGTRVHDGCAIAAAVNALGYSETPAAIRSIKETIAECPELEGVDCRTEEGEVIPDWPVKKAVADMVEILEEHLKELKELTELVMRVVDRRLP